MKHAEHAVIWCELRELFDPEQARLWLISLQPQLSFRRPADCAFDEVMRVIEQLRNREHSSHAMA
jgi:hypothetical protein